MLFVVSVIFNGLKHLKNFQYCTKISAENMRNKLCKNYWCFKQLYCIRLYILGVLSSILDKHRSFVSATPPPSPTRDGANSSHHKTPSMSVISASPAKPSMYHFLSLTIDSMKWMNEWSEKCWHAFISCWTAHFMLSYSSVSTKTEEISNYLNLVRSFFCNRNQHTFFLFLRIYYCNTVSWFYFLFWNLLWYITWQEVGK